MSKVLRFDDFLFESQNKYKPFELVLEGGAYGHVTHPFEDMSLKMSDVYDMIKSTIKGAFGPENFVQEKCLSGESVVQLEKNGPTTIKSVVENRIEDNVLTSNTIGELSYQPIMDWVKYEDSNEWLEIETEDGEIIRVTPNHRFFVEGLDIKAEDLKIGDELLTVKNMLSKKSKIKSIRKISNSESCYDLTVGNNCRYFANSILVHNTDGQQLSISWKNGKLIAARNKSHLKNAGADALDINGIATLFAGRGDIEIVYNAAMRDLTNSIGALSSSDKAKYFAEGTKFASLEIISPVTQNTVPYGLNMLVFHGVIEYDAAGNPIAEDKQAGRDLGRLVKEANVEAQETFFIRGSQDMNIKPFPNTSQREIYYTKKYQDILKQSNLNANSSIQDYAMGMAKNVLIEEANKSKIKLPDNDTVIDGLCARIAGINKSFSISKINGELGENANWFIDLENMYAKELKAKIYAPLESLFLEVGTEFMKNMTSFLSANPTAAAEAMRKEIEKTISQIKTNGDEEDIKKLEIQLNRLTAVGGLENIVPTEGITFVYKGKLYKYTGIFSPIHQIRSILAYKK